MNTRTETRPELLDMRGACAVLNLGRTKVTELIQSGELPSAQVGRKRVFRRRDIDAYVARLFGEEFAQ